jgi:hypothetical protein
VCYSQVGALVVSGDEEPVLTRTGVIGRKDLTVTLMGIPVRAGTQPGGTATDDCW